MSAGVAGSWSARRSSRICCARAPRSYSAPSDARSPPIAVSWRSSSVTRALAVQMRPTGGSTMRGCFPRSSRASGRSSARRRCRSECARKWSSRYAPRGHRPRSSGAGCRHSGARASASSHGGRTLEAQDVHVGCRRQLREPRPEPTGLPLGISLQQHPLRPGFHLDDFGPARRGPGSSRARWSAGPCPMRCAARSR